MAVYRVKISQSAEKQLGKLPRRDQQRVANVMSALANDPSPRGEKKLSGYEDVFRVREGWEMVVETEAIT